MPLSTTSVGKGRESLDRAPTPAAKNSRRLWRVLIVHAHNLFREGLARMLAEAGDLEIVAHTGDLDEAIALTQTHRPEIVIVDGDLPDTDGHLVGRLKASSPDARLLLLSDKALQAEVEHYLSEGADGITLKQVSGTELAETIRQVGSGETYLHPAAAAMLVRALSNLTGRHTDGPVLTQRQKEILRLVALGMQNKQIARHLGIGVDTVKTHISRILDKLHVSSRTEAIAIALREGLVH